MRKVLITIIVLLTLILATMTGILITAGRADTGFVCAVTKGEWVWLRAEPSPSGEKIGTIRHGVVGEIHEITNQYARITTADGRQGWADVSYLLMPIKEEIWEITTKDPLNKRETPGGRYMGRIKGGSRISVLGWRYDKNGELWAHVYHGGYVMAKYLAKGDSHE